MRRAYVSCFGRLIHRQGKHAALSSTCAPEFPSIAGGSIHSDPNVSWPGNHARIHLHSQFGGTDHLRAYRLGTNHHFSGRYEVAPGDRQCGSVLHLRKRHCGRGDRANHGRRSRTRTQWVERVIAADDRKDESDSGNQAAKRQSTTAETHGRHSSDGNSPGWLATQPRAGAEMLLLLIAARIPFDSRQVIAMLSEAWSSTTKVLNKAWVPLWWPISTILVLLGQRGAFEC